MKPPRLPLGDPCRGECTAHANTAEPSLEDLRLYCNVGYARGICARFPKASETADAVRFSITRDDNGTLALLYIVEKDYSPLHYTALIYDTGSANFTTPLESPTVRAQAQRFVESYLNRRIKA